MELFPEAKGKQNLLVCPHKYEDESSSILILKYEKSLLQSSMQSANSNPEHLFLAKKHHLIPDYKSPIIIIPHFELPRQRLQLKK